MLETLFPRRAANEFHGAPLAGWALAAMTLLTLGRSAAHVALPDGGAQSIATIPVDDFTANGAAALIHVFSEWGLSQLLFGLVYVIVLLRYRSLMVEYAGRLLLGFAKPVELSGTAPGAVGNYVFIPLALLMLVLALRERKA